MEINYCSGVILITAGIFCLVSEVRTGTIPLISVRRGEPQVIVPCHSLDGIPPPLVQSVEWTKGTPNTNDDVRENIVVYYFPSNVTSDRGGGTYELSHGHGLVIRTPTSMDSARYTCNVTDTSGVALASIVDLRVTDDDPTDNSGPIHHYIVPVIIVFLVVAESAFIVAMWLNLRKASVTSAHGCPERLDSDLQEHRVEASDGHRGEAVTPPWKTPAGKKQALLLDDLNDGVLLGRRDSGYEERLSIESVSGKHGGELV